MTHQEYRERLDEILGDLKSYYQNECDYIWLASNGEFTVADAKQAIDRLFLDVVGEDAPEQDGWNTESREQNRLRQQLRTTITGKDGGDE